MDVDTGTVSAESITGGPARTLVRATKYLHWRDPDRLDLTMLACASGESNAPKRMFPWNSPSGFQRPDSWKTIPRSGEGFDLDPDVIEGHNVFNFDLPFLVSSEDTKGA
jgi:hypothetical protein